MAEWIPDPDHREYFQRLCGASLVGTVRDHMLNLIHGTGGNGKGTAFGAIGHAIGDYYTVPDKSLIVSQRHDPHPTVRTSLFRTRFAVAAETDQRVKLNEASIKELTGGDLLRARRMYEDEWSFKPSHTLWLQTNHLPDISGTDEGIWRRIKVLPWTNTFTGSHEDREQSEKLEAESAGILIWLLEGVSLWLEQGLGDDTLPAVVRTATDSYRQAEDVLAKWMDESGLVFSPDLTTPPPDHIDSWTEWSGGLRFNETAARLEAAGCHRDQHRRRTAEGRHQTTSWTGIGWPPAPTPLTLPTIEDPRFYPNEAPKT